MLLAEKLKGSDGSLSMGRCSYTWEELFEKRCPRNTWKGSDEFCIFHDPSPDKDAIMFKKKLEKQMESEIKKHDFIGYHFPEDWDFFGQKFKIDADFRGATFHGIDFEGKIFQGKADFTGSIFKGTATFYKATFQDAADFKGATFRDANFEGAKFKSTGLFIGTAFKDVDFRKATFQGADFSRATFQGDAIFWEAIFLDVNFPETTFKDADFREVTFRDANFWGATFRDANFWGAIFQRHVAFGRCIFSGTADFREAIFQGADFSDITVKEFFELNPKSIPGILDFRGVKFFFSGSISVDLENTLFHRAHLQNIIFIDCDWPDDYIIYEEKHRNDKDTDLTFNQLETIYRDLKQTMQNHGDYTKAGEFYYREMEMRRKGAAKKNRIWLEVYRLLAGYGEKPGRVIFMAALVIFIAAVLFAFGGIVIGEFTPEERIINYDLTFSIPGGPAIRDFGQCLYYSFVTFTTLGYGDIHPVGYSKIIACAEAFTGAFFIALFVVVFVRKMAR
jgi:uncharacterized protein YjbI with pentapeptide repeats